MEELNILRYWDYKKFSLAKFKSHFLHNFPNDCNSYKEKTLWSCWVKMLIKRQLSCGEKKKRHVNKALKSVRIKPSKVKNRSNPIRELKKNPLHLRQ